VVETCKGFISIKLLQIIEPQYLIVCVYGNRLIYLPRAENNLKETSIRISGILDKI
jgi:hypothetical protein